MGRKRNKHRRCVEVAAINRYQSKLRRQQRVPGVVTFTYRDHDPSTKCLRRLKNLNFKLAFAIDAISLTRRSRVLLSLATRIFIAKYKCRQIRLVHAFLLLLHLQVTGS